MEVSGNGDIDAMVRERVAVIESIEPGGLVVQDNQPTAQQIIEVESPHHADSQENDSTPCFGHNNLFFSSHRESAAQRDTRIAAAKALCALCDVRMACLNRGINTKAVDGIWGGEELSYGKIINIKPIIK